MAILLQILLGVSGGIFLTHFLSSNTAAQNLKIINAHEHIESAELARIYQAAARAQGIDHTVILGSPEATLEPGKRGFVNADVNNDRMLQLARHEPRRYSFFATLDPADPAKLYKLQDYIRRGAKGLKLYSGHSAYHRKPLDEPTMLPVFAFCERESIPIVFHVNPALYQREFENVLRRYPKLKVVCPHYCLSTIRRDRFQGLMDRFPNLYTDTSFGFEEFFKEALTRFSANPTPYRDLIVRYQDRIIFGLDLVINQERYKDEEWVSTMMRAYRDVLEKEEFTFEGLEGRTLRGFHLDPIILKKIYFANFERLMRKRAFS